MSEVNKVRALVQKWRDELENERVELENKITLYTGKVRGGIENQIRRDAMQKNLDDVEDRVYELEILLAKLHFERENDNGPQTFTEYLEWLNEGNNRQQVGREMELMRLSANKCREKFSELHEYGNQTLDRPIFNADSAAKELD